MDTAPVRIERAVLVGLNAAVFTKEETATERTLDELEALLETAGGVCCGKMLGKPRTEAEAVQMLSMLSGRDHQVMTGVCVVKGDLVETFTEVTDLHFRELSPGEIQRYVDSKEPMDKAGAYGIQGGAALFCEKMEGDYYNVMGLPVCHLGQVLRRIAPEWTGDTQ